MAEREASKHRIKDKGGPLGGLEVDVEAPAFDFGEFMKSPNVKEFVKKQ